MKGQQLTEFSVHRSDDLTKVLNQMREKGWEVVTLEPHPTSHYLSHRGTVKRVNK